MYSCYFGRMDDLACAKIIKNLSVLLLILEKGLNFHSHVTFDGEGVGEQEW